MTSKKADHNNNQLLIAKINELLLDPQYSDNPLIGYLSELLDICNTQQDKLNRIISISDGYHELIRANNEDLSRAHLKQAKRLRKLAKISDFYQNNLHELSSKMEQAALVDILTGLYNRRYLITRLERYESLAARKENTFSLAILDLDYFKTINDQYSHSIGDQTLKEIGKVILSSIRETDLCGRWGGEEFLIVYPDTDLQTAEAITKRLLDNISLLEIQLIENNKIPHITASAGISIYHPHESYTATIERADLALYQAKNNGRNTTATIDDL